MNILEIWERADSDRWHKFTAVFTFSPVQKEIFRDVGFVDVGALDIEVYEAASAGHDDPIVRGRLLFSIKRTEITVIKRIIYSCSSNVIDQPNRGRPTYFATPEMTRLARLCGGFAPRPLPNECRLAGFDVNAWNVAKKKEGRREHVKFLFHQIKLKPRKGEKYSAWKARTGFKEFGRLRNVETDETYWDGSAWEVGVPA